MSERVRLTKDWFHNPIKCKIMRYGQFIDPWYGLESVEISEEQVEALKQGKVLYFDDDEYATVIRLEERKEE